MIVFVAGLHLTEAKGSFVYVLDCSFTVYSLILGKEAVFCRSRGIYGAVGHGYVLGYVLILWYIRFMFSYTDVYVKGIYVLLIYVYVLIMQYICSDYVSDYAIYIGY